MIKAAIFDVDGTLLNSMPAWENVGSSYVKAQGLVPAEDLDRRVKEFCLRDLSMVLINEYGIDKAVDDIENEISLMVRDKYYYSIPLKPGVEKLVEELYRRGIKMCIASASRHDHIEEALKRCGIMKYFTKIFSCVDVGSSKREREIFDLCLEHLETTAEETYMFDDALYVAETVRPLGLVSVGIYDEYMAHQEELERATDFYIKDYNELDEFWAWLG